MEGKKILLLGETCLDKFIYGTCDRLNPEAPTPVFKETKSHSNVGMAGNVYENLKWLGLPTEFISNKAQITKSRFVDEVSNYILIRVDDEPKLKALTLKDIDVSRLEEYDAIVISDYNKGLLGKEFLSNLFTHTKALNIKTFMDTKKDIDEWAIECDYIKINQKEFNNPKHIKYLSNNFFKNKLIVTLGSDGCLYSGQQHKTMEVPVRDVVGAGDTFLAGLVYGYLIDGEIESGIRLANRLSADVVSKRGVALPDKKMI